MIKRKTGFLRAVFFTVLIGVLFFPLITNAGSLEPLAAPAPTMKTLDEIYSTGSWSRKIPCDVGNCPRFEVLADFNNEAVLDKETGLVWDKSPVPVLDTWSAANYRCADLNLGGRKGWHVPTLEQLNSLVDRSAISSPMLPAGHPFINVQSADYWSATIRANDTTKVRSVYFGNGLITAYDRNSAFNYTWCVRGGQNFEGQ